MRLTLGELHIYGGLVLAALGVGLALGPGWGLLLLGCGLIPLGLVIAATEREEPAAPSTPPAFEGLMTAADVAEEEVA